MERHVLLKLRIANNLDFSDENGNKKFGVPYFCKNSKNIIEQKINYFTAETNLLDFKKLYSNAQIYVIKNPFDCESTFNCIDWNLVNQELDFELNKLNEITQ